MAPVAFTRFHSSPSRNTAAMGGAMYACTFCR